MSQSVSDEPHASLELGNTIQARDSRAYAWCFTLNNWTQDEYDEVLSYCLSEVIVAYVVGKEVGDERGTPHLQGWLKGKNQIRFQYPP